LSFLELFLGLSLNEFIEKSEYNVLLGPIANERKNADEL